MISKLFFSVLLLSVMGSVTAKDGTDAAIDSATGDAPSGSSAADTAALTAVPAAKVINSTNGWGTTAAPKSTKATCVYKDVMSDEEIETCKHSARDSR